MKPMFIKVKKKQQGLSLIESAMVLALGASVIAGVLYYYNNTQEKYEVNEGIKTVQTVAATVNKLYIGQSEMTGRWDNQEEKNKVIQAVADVAGLETTKINGATVMKTPAGRFLELWNIPELTRAYRLDLQTDSLSACISYATLNLGTQMKKKTQVYTGRPPQGGANGDEGGPLSPQEASNICKENFDRKGGEPLHIRYTLGF